MKNIILVFIIFLNFICFSQTNSTDKVLYEISYEMRFKKFENSNKTNYLNTSLYFSENESIFTLDKMVKVSKIKQERNLNAGDVISITSPFYFFIKRNNNSVNYFESLGKDFFKYNSEINFDWTLINEKKVISDFTCFKATLNYYGRKWIAWYTTEIPLNAGPYYFYGLPGLILDISDSEDIFNFKMTNITKKI